MKNKLFLVCAALFAQQSQALMMEPRTSFYVGGQLGYNHSISKFNSTLVAQDPLDPAKYTDVSSDVSDIAKGSFAGGAHIGMGYRFPNCMYLGGEFRYTAFSSTAKRQVVSTLAVAEGQINNTINLKNLADLSILIGGYICENTLVYARLGGCFGTRQTLTTGGSFGTGVTKKNLGGFSGGVGVKINCTSRVYLGFDYTFNALNSLNQQAINDEGIKTHNNSTKNQYCHLALFSVGIRLAGW